MPGLRSLAGGEFYCGSTAIISDRGSRAGKRPAQAVGRIRGKAGHNQGERRSGGTKKGRPEQMLVRGASWQAMMLKAFYRTSFFLKTLRNFSSFGVITNRQYGWPGLSR